MSKLFKFMPKNWPAGVAGAVGVSLVIGLFTGTTGPSIMVSAVLAGIFSFATIFLLALHDALLSARVKADAPIAWDVWMNGVKIGCITDAQYAAIQRHAFSSGRWVGAQTLNLGRVALNIAGKLFVGVPLLMFWVLLVAGIATPESLTEIAQAWRDADLATMKASFGTLLHFVAMVSILSVAIMFILGFRFGLRNYYTEFIARMIRQQCNTPTEGDIHLSKIDMTADVVPHS